MSQHKIMRASIILASLLGIAAATLDAKNEKDRIGSARLRNFDIQVEIGAKIATDDAAGSSSKSNKTSRNGNGDSNSKSNKTPSPQPADRAAPSIGNSTRTARQPRGGRQSIPITNGTVESPVDHSYLEDRDFLHKNDRIIGGKEAEEDYYSFTVALADDYGQFCGGSMIAKDVVLTAAHCQGDPFHVVIGRHDLRDDDGEEIDAIEQRPHPDYDAMTTDNDVMLVFLKDPTSLNVDLVKVNDDADIPEIDEEVIVMGWGDTDASDEVSLSSQVLLKVPVNVITNRECENSEGDDGSYEDQITENMLCARADLQDSCQGDSGGPLITSSGGQVGQEVQVGVVSWGIGCASQDFPGVYARLSKSHDWIEKEVCKTSKYASEAGFKCAGNFDSGNTFSTPRPTPKPTRNAFLPNSASKGTACDGITNKSECKGTSGCRWKYTRCMLREREDEFENGDGDDGSLYSDTALL